MFIHSDLGVDHILADPYTGHLSGVIDFDWAGVGDPALDFVGVLTALGPDATRELIQAHDGSISWPRLRFYWWLNPCYELIYAGPHLDEQTFNRGINTLRTRRSTLDPTGG